MPEGDTLRRLASSLDRTFAGQTVRSSIFRHPRLATLDLTGTRLLEADACGKHLLLRFEGGYTLHVHLKMNGAVYARLPRSVNSERRKFEIQFEQGWMTAIDIAVLELLNTADEAQAIGHLGPDICGHYDHEAAFERLVHAGSIPTTQAMLDQRIVAGFGNIYAVETPFIVGVNPNTPVDRLERLDGLLSIGVALIRTNARFGPQNTTGKDLRHTHHWVLSGRIFQCPICGSRLHRVPGSASPWQRRYAWCGECQPADACVVDLQRAAKLLSLHPCRQIVDLANGKLIADVSKPVVTLALAANEGGQKRMK